MTSLSFNFERIKNCLMGLRIRELNASYYRERRTVRWFGKL